MSVNGGIGQCKQQRGDMMRSTKLMGCLTLFVVVALSGCAPRDQEDCIARAAKEAKTNAALEVLINSCEREFPAKRRDDGTYAYYDGELYEWVTVSGPTLSDADVEKIQSMRAEKENAARREKVEKSKIIEKLKVISYNVSCNMDDTYTQCWNKNITLRVQNQSDRTVNGLTISYEIGKNIDCSGSLGKSFSNDIEIPAGGVGSIVHNVTFADAGPEGIMSGCVRVSGIGSVGGDAVPLEKLPDHLKP